MVKFIIFSTFLFLLSCGSSKDEGGSLFTNTALTNAELGASPSDEWILVPANAGGMGLNAFYVMKYEAKAQRDSDSVVVDGNAVDVSLHTPVSVPEELPWRDISPTDAVSECRSIGADYDLISNAEWMAIARDIESVSSNWTGVPGSSCIFRGNSSTSASCGYSNGSLDSGTSRSSFASLTLSNNQIIFDMAGNLSEWVDWESGDAGFTLGPVTCTSNSQLNVPGFCAALALDDFSPSGNLDASNGAGFFYGGNGGAALRGGFMGEGFAVGIYSLNMTSNISSSYRDHGFRCVKR